MTMHLKGKVSWFGGPHDTGVSPSEGLAFIYSVDDAPELFLSYQPSGTTGLARRLDPDEHYVACRWDYDAPYQSKTELLEHKAAVRAPKTGRQFVAAPADWGPHEDTGRVADISPGLMSALGIETDDEVEVIYPYDEDVVMPAYHRVAISSGHGARVAGASGYVQEYPEAVRVSDRVAQLLQAHGVTVMGAFHDTVSTTQNANLNLIVTWHNAQTRDLDVSIHFNCNKTTQKPVGTECLYVTQEDLARKVSAAIATSGLIDRGAKYRDGLYFLNNTEMPAILVEVCFVDSAADVEIYQTQFETICAAIADVLAGSVAPRPPEPAPEEQVVSIAIEVPASIELKLTINGNVVVL